MRVECEEEVEASEVNIMARARHAGTTITGCYYALSGCTALC